MKNPPRPRRQGPPVPRSSSAEANGQRPRESSPAQGTSPLGHARPPRSEGSQGSHERGLAPTRPTEQPRTAQPRPHEAQGDLRRGNATRPMSGGEVGGGAAQGGSRRRAGDDRTGSGSREASSRRGAASLLRSLRKPTGDHDAADALGSSRDERSSATVERIDERIRARRYGWVRTLMMVCLSGSVVAAVVWVVFFSALFALQADRIVVTGGDERFSDQQAHEMLARHAGVPISRLWTSNLEEELAAVTQVKSAVVSRSWPDGLSVELTMRVPVMAEQTSEGFALIDEEAIVLGSQSAAPEGMPVVVFPSSAEERLKAADDLRVVRAALPESFTASVAKWVIEAHQIRCEMKDGRLVKWGTVEDSVLKAKVLIPLFEQRSAKVYDVSAPLTPVTAE